MATVAPLAELYHDPDIQYEAKRWSDMQDHSFDELIAIVGPIGHITTQSALVEQLDELEGVSETRRVAASLLGCLPTRLLLHTYGEKVTVWTLGNDEFGRRTEDLTEELDTLGFNGALLRQAVLLSHQISQTPTSSEVLAQQTVMEKVLGNGLDNIDLPAVLRQAVLPGITLSDKRINDYALIRLAAEFNECLGGRVYNWQGKSDCETPGLFYDLWLDTPAGFALTYKGCPQAIVGVQAKGESELFIKQLQGIRGIRYEEYPEKKEGVKRRITGYKSARGLPRLEWRKLGVEVCARLAQQIDFDSVGMITGKKVPSKRCRLSGEAAYQAYDAQAALLGFSPNGDDDWHKPLADFQLA